MEPSDTKSSSRTQHPIFLRLALAWSVLTPFCSACSGQLGLGLTNTADGRVVVFLGPAVLLGHSWSRTSGPRLTCALSILSNQRQSRRAPHPHNARTRRIHCAAPPGKKFDKYLLSQDCTGPAEQGAVRGWLECVCPKPARSRHLHGTQCWVSHVSIRPVIIAASGAEEAAVQPTSHLIGLRHLQFSQ